MKHRDHDRSTTLRCEQPRPGLPGIVAALGVSAVLLGAPGAAGAATIGPGSFPASADVNRLCLSSEPCTFAATNPPTGAAYSSASPVDGVVVKWRALFAGSGSSSARFRVFKPGNAMGSFEALGTGANEVATPGAHSFGTRLQIEAGDRIGLDMAASSVPTLGVGSRNNSGATLSRTDSQPPDPTLFNFGTTFADSELLVGADVEPDADDDGYGDVTQDLCPSDPGPGPCDATLTIGAPDLTGATATVANCFTAAPCSLWTSSTPIGQNRQRWASPIDGVIVRWRVRLYNFAQGPAHPVLGPYRLRTVRQAGGVDFPVVGASAFETVPHTLVASDTVHTFATRVPVRAGDRLALDMPPKPAAPSPGGLRFDPRGGSHRYVSPSPPDAGSFTATGAVTGAPFYNVDVEPDADKDGFGDVTQDSCPTDATTQGTCPLRPGGDGGAGGTGTDSVGPAVGISRRAVRLTRKGSLRVRMSCPRGEPLGCRAGVLKLASAKRVSAAAGRVVRLGSKRFSIPAGRSTVVRIRLSRRNRTLVRRRGRLRVRARASAIDQAGNRRATTATFALLPARR